MALVDLLLLHCLGCTSEKKQCPDTFDRLLLLLLLLLLVVVVVVVVAVGYSISHEKRHHGLTCENMLFTYYSIQMIAVCIHIHKCMFRLVCVCISKDPDPSLE